MAGTLMILGPAHPYRGGLATFNERLATEFQQMGWEVEMYTFTLQYPNFLFPGKTQFTDTPPPKNLKITRKINAVNPLNWRKIGREIKRKKPDILLTRFWIPFMGPSLGTIARMVKKNKHTRVVSLLDNVIPHEHRIGDKLLTRYFVGSIHSCVAMTESVRQDLYSFDSHKPCALSPHPLFDNFGKRSTREEALTALNLDMESRYVLFFGFIRDYKGLDLLLKAFADRYFEEHKIKLIVAGEYYADAEPYKALIRKYDLQERVIEHTHFIADDQVAHYFCGADICVQPYKSATQSGVTQIAYHFHLPMIVTNVGGLPEMVPDGKVGYVVSVDEKEITEKLRIFFDQNQREAFVQGIKEEKSKYSWDKMVNAILEVSNQNNNR